MKSAEWLLSYPGTSFSFGEGQPVELWGPPEFGDAELTSDDEARPRMDGTMFGQDFRGGRTITFTLGMQVENDHAAVMQLASRLETAWRGDAVRSTPAAVATLTSGEANRMVLGRPRRLAIDYAGLYRGWLRAVADFATIDDVWYDAQQRFANVQVAPPSSGGFLAPFITPIGTMAPATAHGVINVVTELPAWTVATIYGPISNPTFRVTNLFDLKLRTSIPAGESVTIDTRPWKRTILRDSDGASLAGKLDRRTRLDRTGLSAGRHEIALLGTDGTGSASMTVRWAGSYASMAGGLTPPDVVDGLILESGSGGNEGMVA